MISKILAYKSFILCLGLTACIFLSSSEDVQAMGKKPPKEKPSIDESLVTEIHELQPLTLEDCFQLALRQSETLAMRKIDIEKTKADFLKATGEAIGSFDFVMTNTRQKVVKGSSDSSVGSSFNAPSRRERKFVIAQPLFQGFKTLGALQGAGSLRKQREDEWTRAKELLFLDVSKAFYDVMRLKKDVETTKEIDELFKERIAELKEREKIGRSRTSEVVSAEARMKIIEADLAKSRGALEIAKHILEFLIGKPLEPEQLKEESLELEDNRKLEDYLEAEETRSDVQAAKHAVTTARGGVIVAQSDLWPSFSLVNNQYQKREGFQSGIDWDLVLKVDVPLGKGGTTFGNIKNAVSDWKKTKLSYSLTKRQAELDIKQSYQNWISYREQSKALEEAMKASEENFREQAADYEHNLVSNLDVLTALESLHDTRRQANETYYQMKQNYWRLKVATGEVL